MAECRNCRWFGYGVITRSKVVFSPLVNGDYTIYYENNEPVCNINQTSMTLDRRLNACKDYENKVLKHDK